MNKTLIHISDIHFRENWNEEQGVVLKAFFNDLGKQISKIDKSNVYAIFSGDFVLAGGNSNLYEEFFKQFDFELNKLGILKNRRICIPGNHDVSLDIIKKNEVEHEGIVSQRLSEGAFNDYISRDPAILKDKFSNYFSFEEKFADLGLNNNLSGCSWNIDENTSIYCLNTAICSSGGNNSIDDKGRLSVDTRNLNKWLQECSSEIKILIMHHPVNWLIEWARVELAKILRNNISLCLSGHLHDHSILHSISHDSPLIECSAPPLLTTKKGNLGYSLIQISNKAVLELQYRQWTKNNTFLTGIDFSGTDDGKIVIKPIEPAISATKNLLGHIFNDRLNTALKSFDSQPIIWVDPIISKNLESYNSPSNIADEDIVNVKDIISSPESSIISAPPQFGLTSLAHHLVNEAWKTDGSIWIYLDALSIKSHAVEKAINKELANLGVKMDDVKCIILDSWSNIEKDSIKMLKNLSDSYMQIPTIIMQTIDDSKFMEETNELEIEREFKSYNLLALTRGHIRKVVSSYNVKKYIADEDTVMSKVIMDLEALNIHRTPLNCLTLLKVSEKYFDESPVNRTRMLELVLTLLFDMDNIPTYKTKPDLKDCEYVLGYYCAKMIRSSEYQFTRESFSNELHSFCSEKLIDLEVDIVFDVLYANNIIINRNGSFAFRFSYWIYYFAAQRMHHDSTFASFIFDNKNYVSYPEIIEFYTGIDRRREDALVLLTGDLREICSIVKDKVGIPDEMNPYKFAKWIPSEESLQKIHKEIAENVLNSKLPDSVKDKYADQGYNPIRPYDQNIYSIFREYSLVVLFQGLKAASRALRNSDYVNPDVKRELLNEIIRAWHQVSKVIIALSPVLATDGVAAFEGQGFRLVGGFKSGITFEQKIGTILNVIPMTIVNWFKDDLFSNKMSSLIYDHISNEQDELKKYELILFVVYERPNNWKNQISDYIISISKNSYYLMNLTNELCSQYQYLIAPSNVLRDIEYLIKMGLAKHEFGEKKPGIDKIAKISNKNIPKRDVNEDF